MSQPDSKVRVLNLILPIVRGILGSMRYRRRVMIGLILAASFMVFAGTLFFQDFLMARPWWFVLYWLVCAWITLTAVLLALYDMLMVRLAARQARRKLREEMARTQRDNQEPNE